MDVPALLLNDEQRVAALKRYQILDTLPESDYEEITWLASQICQTPVALIAFLDEKRQWFKSNRGLAIRQTPRELAFCAYNILDPFAPLIVDDARLDERFAHNPLVRGEPYIVFYAGVPLVDAAGFALGSLCVIDHQVRQLSPQQLTALTMLTKQVVNLMSLRQANQTVSMTQERNRALVEASPVATCLFVGADLVIELANEPMIRFFGRGPAILGQSVRSVLTGPEADAAAIALLEQVWQTGTPFTAQAAPAELTLDGVKSTYYFDLSLNPLRGASGEVYAILETAVDVTTQVLNRQQLQASATYFRRLTDTVPTILWETDPDGYCVYLNRQWYVATGQTPAQAEGFGWLEVTHPDDQAQASRLFNEANHRRTPFSILYRLRQRDGHYRWSLDVGSPRFNESGHYEGMVGTVVDVHEQVLARQQLEESEARLRALSADLEQQVQARTAQLQASVLDLSRSNDNLEQFAYVASHDMQEPLRKIQAFGDILKNQYGDQLGEGVTYLERMQTAAGRMSTLIRDLLAYSRIAMQRDASDPVSLMDVLSQVLSTLDVVIEETGAQLSLEPLPTVPGDASQLGQLFQNLLGNAIKFSRVDRWGVPKVPQIAIRSRLVEATQLPPLVKPVHQTRQYYQIDVADNGIGFEEQYLDRIFQVFQRLHSKGAFAGTGIGLAICEKVVANHGGAITATSQPGQGATFSVYLPAE